MERAVSTYNELYHYGYFIVERGSDQCIVTMKEAKYLDSTCLACEGAIDKIIELTGMDGEIKSLNSKDDMDCKFAIIWH